MSVAEKTYTGQCLCGAVTIEVSGDPEAAGAAIVLGSGGTCPRRECM